jgi:hypothetical protein
VRSASPFQSQITSLRFGSHTRNTRRRVAAEPADEFYIQKKTQE